jgi:hypothetical protein
MKGSDSMTGWHMRSGLGAMLVELLLSATALAASPARAAQDVVQHGTFVEGRLFSIPGQGPVVRVGGKNQALSATTPYLLHTLLDKRLANRQVRVEGAWKANGTFEVARLFTVKDGKLYRVRYFCRTCNIVALEPGNCACCQQPTELQEIPVTQNDN